MSDVSQQLHDAAQAAVREGLVFLRKDNLKELCRSQLLPVSGNKRQLAQRLMNYYNSAKIQVAFGMEDGHCEVTIRAWYEPLP